MIITIFVINTVNIIVFIFSVQKQYPFVTFSVHYLTNHYQKCSEFKAHLAMLNYVINNNYSRDDFYTIKLYQF